MNIICGMVGLFKSFFNIGIVEPPISAHRISQCWACPYMVMKSQRCRICGCFLKHKVRLVSQSCPRGRW